MTNFEKMYNGSWYTITGAGGDINEWKEGIQNLLTKDNIGTVKEWEVFSGEEMNELGHLTGTNAYPDDLTFIAFSLDGLNTGKLAMFKLRMGDRWFDDIVDNNAEREGYHPFNTRYNER